MKNGLRKVSNTCDDLHYIQGYRKPCALIENVKVPTNIQPILHPDIYAYLRIRTLWCRITL